MLQNLIDCQPTTIYCSFIWQSTFTSTKCSSTSPLHCLHLYEVGNTISKWHQVTEVKWGALVTTHSCKYYSSDHSDTRGWRRWYKIILLMLHHGWTLSAPHLSASASCSHNLYWMSPLLQPEKGSLLLASWWPLAFEAEVLHTIAVQQCHRARDYSSCAVHSPKIPCSALLKLLTVIGTWSLINSKNMLKPLGNLLSKMTDVY